MAERQARDLKVRVRVPVQVQMFLLKFDNELTLYVYWCHNNRSTMLVPNSRCLYSYHVMLPLSQFLPATFYPRRVPSLRFQAR